MTRQVARVTARTRVSPSKDWVAPTGGWRTDVEMADMPADAAFQLDNFFPEANRVRARYGFLAFATGLGADVRTIIPYAGVSNRLFAAAGDKIFDITAGGAVGTAAVSGMASAHWSVQQYTNPAGQEYLRLVNGLDTPLLYNGTTWTNNLLVGTATLATQNVAVKNVPYTLSFFGTGSVTLSGAFAGVLNGTGVGNRVTLTFTPAAGTLTLTVAGSVTNAQLETGSVATPYVSSTMITGISDPSLLIAVTAYRSRLWFIEKNSTNVWYLATDAVSGAATVLPVGGNMKYGGTLVSINVWTIPVSTGLQQCLVLMSSEGEIIVFQGSDPSSSTNWGLIGTFKLGRPLGTDRCMLSVGADLAIMTTDGIVPITKAVQLDRGATSLGAITAKIGPTWRETVATIGTTSDQWQLSSFPARQMAIVNLPSSFGPYQYVMNTETGAWCRFVGMAASCWGTWQDRLFFGSSDGTVYEAEVGATDNGVAIDALMVGAWNRYGDGLSTKFSKLIGVTAQIGVSTLMYAGISVDYETKVPTALLSSVENSGAAKWGTAIWGVSKFPGVSLVRKFASAGGAGSALAPTIRALISGTSGSVSEAAVVGGSVLYEKGAPI
ncbi:MULTISPECIES: hypothetical protein [unclassified Rhizobium]|uniref:hypothetical protein n=1 Tax=unclassified Rhizobium TaxID=2613769 RepID=UPI0007EA2E0F|nr:MULTISPECIES: hypothetical protein [unclassified Rhizobium]ANM10395.1 hypothetical protein AMK05_CH02009 [Rhizobium sp. N324]ANM16880.1 hypothetical protein AMK06_CH01978 [Rhizobium sp. N541]ANM23265.1 hypothetical protein AMK07_CH01975 [Rhizobium sp. N941]OYD03725.1 hypothetical protein AMK08_CH101743 [Rhizobium sp. N4311]